MKNQPESTKPRRGYSQTSHGPQKRMTSGMNKATNERNVLPEGTAALRKTTSTRRRFDRTEHDGSDHLL